MRSCQPPVRLCLMVAGLVCLAALPALAQTDLLFEDFEDATVTYTPTVADDLTDIAASDYFGRIDGSVTLPGSISYSSPRGSGFYGAQDTDGANSGNVDVIVLNFTGITISNFSSLMFSIYVAEDDEGANQDWDASSSLRVEVQIDGGGYVNLFAVEAESNAGDETNEEPREDTDFDGIGDGTAITDTFVQFSKAISGTGASLDLRITIEGLDAGDEDIAIDEVRITGVAAASAPSCTVNSPANSASLAGTTTFDFDATSPSGNMLTASFSYSTNGGSSFAAATDAGTGGLAGNPTANFAAGAGLTWDWASPSDVAGAETVEFRIIVSDAVTGDSDTCLVTGLDVDNAPACTVNSPANSASLAGTTTFDFDATSPSGNMLTASFAYSTNGGSSFSAATDAGTGGLAGNPTANFAAGAGLTWDWASPSDVAGAETVEFRIIVSDAVTGASDTCLVTSLDVSNGPGCTINSPANGASLAADVSISFDGTDPGNTPLTSTFEYSIDGGMTWSPASAAAASAAFNPDPARTTPFSGVTFVWDTFVDVLGLSGPQTVDFRIQVDNGSASQTCTLTGLSIDNTPSCTINSPANGASLAADVSISFDGTDPRNDVVTSTFEYSIDGGTTWNLTTPVAGSLIGNPDNARSTPFAVSFLWDTVSDGLGLSGAQTVDFRIQVDNGFGSQTCTLTGLSVNNTPSCTINSPANGAAVSADVTINFDGADPDNAALNSTFEYSSDGGATWSPATAAAASALANPDVSRTTPFSEDFVWDSVADGVNGAVLFRISVDNGSTGSTCSLSLTFNVPGQPSCSISSPSAGAPSSGDVSIVYAADDTQSDPLTSTFQYSTNGSSWLAATAASGSPLANPDSMRATPFSGVTFVWDSDSDLASVAASSSAGVRIIVSNGTNSETCTVAGLDFDRDRDGLGNAYEVAIGSDPDKQDSDGDGVDDGVEVALGTPPDMASSYIDNDGDGIPQGSDSDDNNPDLNGDGIMDGFALALNQDGTIDTPLGYGDANLDGVIDFADVGLIFQFARSGVMGGVLPFNLDMNRDGLITIADGMVMLYALRKLTPAIPLSP